MAMANPIFLWRSASLRPAICANLSEPGATYDHDSLDMESGACLAPGTTWARTALEPPGCPPGGITHGRDSSPGLVRRRAGAVGTRAGAFARRHSDRPLAEAQPDQDLGHAWHLTPAV